MDAYSLYPAFQGAQVRLEAVSLDKNGEVLFAAMPELLTLILLGIGLEGLAGFRRKFKKS